MKDEDFEVLSKAYHKECARRNEIQTIESKIKDINKMLDKGLKEDGYTSITEMSINVSKRIESDGRSAPDFTSEKIILNNKDMLKELLLVYKEYLQEKLEGLIKEEN